RAAWLPLLLLLAASGLRAQTIQTIFSDSAPISNFELYRDGLFFWNVSSGQCNSRVAVMPARYPGAPVLNSASACSIFSFSRSVVVRDDMYLYFFANAELDRVAVAHSTGGLPARYPTDYFPQINGPATVLVDGRLYWIDRNPAEQTNYVLRSMPVNSGTPSPEASFTLTAVATPRQLQRLVLPNAGSPATVYYFLNGTDLHVYDGTLNRVGTSVLDYVAAVVGETAYLYTLDAPAGRQAPSPGTINARDPQTGAITGPVSSSLDSITTLGLDSSHLFWAVLSPTATPGSYDVSCFRRAHAGGSPQVIATDTGVASVRNLRSDGRKLYFIETRGSSTPIRAIDLEVPAPPLDVLASALEITQGVQTLSPPGDISLATGKPTFVRGYAYLAENGAGIRAYRSSARLTGFRDGVPLGEILPFTSGVIDSTGSMQDLRPAVNRSFNFVLPPSWVSAPGQLTLTMTAGGNYGTFPETGSLANNSVTAATTLLPAPDICLEFLAVDFEGGPGDFALENIPNFEGIISRARTLMPATIRAFRSRIPVHRKPGFSAYYPFAPGEISYAFHHMNARFLFSSGVTGCGRHIRVGMMHPSVPDNGTIGYGGVTSNIVVKMEGGMFSPLHDSPRGGVTLAHETYHAYSYSHIQQDPSCGTLIPACPCGAAPFPPNTCWIGADSASGVWGYDPISNTAIGPTTAADVMTYATSTWISGRSWEVLLGAPLRQVVSTPRASRVVAVSARLDTSGSSAEAGGFYLVDSELVPSPPPARQEPDSEDFELVFLDGGGGELGREPLSPFIGSDAAEPSYSLAESVPFVEGAATLRIERGNTPLLERTLSANAPHVTLQAPIYDAGNQSLKVRGSASDADGDVLLFTTQYSPDGGQTWQALVADDPNLRGTFDASLLPGGDNALVRVIATDGLLTGTATSAPFAMPKHAPVVEILGPSEGRRIPFGEPVTVTGIAYDAEDGPIAANA
ncbi:hypothetical protein HZA57_01855, partial [Candidatus Poribacteria bacterium]|nr:hypothetical protein [Candidatus Poribacteria bacterium]